MKNKEIILKESPNTDEETLEHCLTAIQAMLDMDDFERAYDYLNGFVSEIITQTKEETIRAVEERLPKAQKINKKDWLGLNYTLGDVKYREHQYSLLVLDILNKLKK